MTSRLVETMMINVEDFADSFLTCGTCLSGYDSGAHSAKLLPCSHTVCRTCLERIIETQSEDETTMRCPICRETIAVPRSGGGGGGAAAGFPPAFMVNQLLDLMASQRRDRVPTCRRHPAQELLFCETCDVIFCPECRPRNSRGHVADSCGGGGGSDGGSVGSESGTASVAASVGGGGGAVLSHNVISFSVAIKRCSEILLYKASLCVQELNSAQEAVSAELQRLAQSSEACIAAAESSFAEVRALVERRQAEVLRNIRRLGDEKRRALEHQLALIDAERALVRQQCDALNSLVDVRSISKGISYLNDKLDTIASLTEPRENAFLRYHDNPLANSTGPVTSAESGASSAVAMAPGSAGFVDIARCLAAFGRVVVSTTYPPLCTAKLPDELHAHLIAKVVVRAYDYNGAPQQSGTDPVSARLTDAAGWESAARLADRGDGTYEVTLLPLAPGPHSLAVSILSRPIRASPFALHVRHRQRPRWSILVGADGRSLVQPFAVAVLPTSRLQSEAPEAEETGGGWSVVLLDTGNSRLLIADAASGRVTAALAGNEALRGQAATGMALHPRRRGLWVANWRANELLLLDLTTNQVVDRIGSPRFMEPTSVSVCPRTGRVLVADNGAGCVFVCDPDADPTHREVRAIIGADSARSGALRRVTGICVTSSGEIILAAGSELRVYSADGVHLGCLYAPPSAALVGGEAASGIGDRSSAPGSTLTLAHRESTVLAPLRRPASLRPTSGGGGQAALRGHFGGVSMARTNSELGECLLASHTDRARSAVIVFPEVAWRAVVGSGDAETAEAEAAEEEVEEAREVETEAGSCAETLGASLLREARRQPFALEVEPGLRRLAGLAALPTEGGGGGDFSAHHFLVAVDLGGQAAHCFRFI